MKIEDWGLIDYSAAAEKQLQLVDEVASGKTESTIVFCSHPPVVTLGRAANPSDLIGWKGAVVETSRGGRATYHGPSQLVIYPIWSLQQGYQSSVDADLFFRPRDVKSYLHFLENWVAKTLHRIGFPDAVGSHVFEPTDDLSRTGVWIEKLKVASIGIAVKKWVAYHGIAINCTPDPMAFQGIRPCGFTTSTMISLDDLSQDQRDWADLLKTNLVNLLDV